MRFACDTGGTFTDLTVEDTQGALRMFKAPTTPDDPIRGVLDVLGIAARAHGLPLAGFLARGEIFIHGTTHAINAIITGNVARTALICTLGHPDILLLRTGGRTDPFNHSKAYPGPFISRNLTFEARERVLSDGSVMVPLDESGVIGIIEQLKRSNIEAVAVSLLWSVVNPEHERKIGALLEKHLPGVPYTLSHRLNPAIREYPRTSSAAIDAALKPLMRSYMGNLTARMTDAGFTGRVLVLRSQGGVMDAHAIASAPIH
jgi:N-methylhydantoinase A